MKENIILNFSPEEAGVVLVALATLAGMQSVSSPNPPDPLEKDYADSSMRVFRKTCVALGLPETYITNMMVESRRELMKRRSKNENNIL